MADSLLSSRGHLTDGADELQVWEVSANQWDPTTNPDGYVSLGIAENSLSHDELAKFLRNKSLVDQCGKAFTYQDGPAGSKPTRNSIATFLNTYFHPAQQIQPDNLIITNGASSAIEHCAWALCDPGDGILLGRPFYRAFLPDIQMRFGVKVVPVAFGEVDLCGSDCVARYEEALLKSNADGVKVRALLLCHPHNPMGRCYSTTTIVQLMRLCQKYRIHLISDEIYALSVWENTVDKLEAPPTPFESALSIDTREIIDPALVHVLWGFSKDFGANGIRIGVMISQHNEPFLTACRTACIYSSPSSLAENAAVAILSDPDFLASYIKTNSERMSAAYTHAVKLLRRYDIEYMPGVNAAFFLWINLSKKYLQSLGDAACGKSMGTITNEIFQLLMKKKVFLVLGDAAGAEQPGWFRMVFTQPPRSVEEGINRISEALSGE
ncbi:PLP-dependent transferase [Karstenula rhodostoma CBS 690.94]|uniref:PLP-dependent transferase n=1 Tax=Karstenula rhodostoma CBS 690.94 TaxID=1392251 RepID=A0A9P4UHV0_9PLEO|nr:PLP-dependent transferase [Karstenula rhodostoma CBS 690.94]